jgi:hypothetical protein
MPRVQTHSGRTLLPLCDTPRTSARGDLNGVSATPESQHPLSKAHACGTPDDGLITRVISLWRTLGANGIRTDQDTALGIRVGVVIIAEVTEDRVPDIDNVSS